MSVPWSRRFRTLLAREVTEHRTSFLWTPLVVASLLGVLMLGSVVLANRISVIGDLFLESLLEAGAGVTPGMAISITVDDGRESGVLAGAPETAPAAGVGPEPAIVVEVEDATPRESWNFSRDWTFQPGEPETAAKGQAGDDDSGEAGAAVETLNPLLNAAHGMLLLIAFAVTINYLLGALYEDRKDRSILFWSSMPVAEREIVLSKFATGLLVIPLIYTAVSLALQVVLVLLVMLLAWRLDASPFVDVLARIDIVAALVDSLGGLVVTALWIAPACAWLLLASAVARRSPLLTALLPVLGLLFVDKFVIGSRVVGSAILNHVPHLGEAGSVGFYFSGVPSLATDLIGLMSGLLFAAALLALTTWFRRYRWEL